MPLKKGKGKKTVSVNIDELMGTYKKTGKIGNTEPRSTKHALQIAIAISKDVAKKG